MAVEGVDGGEELAVALVAAVGGDEGDGGGVDGEEGADGVELGGEDLEDDEGEGELGEGGAHVGSFEGALGGADLDEPGWVVRVVDGVVVRRGGWGWVGAREDVEGWDEGEAWDVSFVCDGGRPGDLLVSGKNHRPGPMKPEVQVIFRVRLRGMLAIAISIADCKPGLPTAGTRHTFRKAQGQPGESPT